MSELLWHQVGDKVYENGVEKTVLFPVGTGGVYSKGVAWNGIVNITESPSGAESSAKWADNSKYAVLVSPEELGAKIEAFTYPDEFALCDGSAELSPGVFVGQQARKPFGLAYKTKIGNDADGGSYGYKIHLLYGAMASPSEKAYGTESDSPDIITFSWDITTSPVSVTGLKDSASVVIDSTRVDAAKLAAFETILYGTTAVEPRLPLPNEVKTLFAIA